MGINTDDDVDVDEVVVDDDDDVDDNDSSRVYRAMAAERSLPSTPVNGVQTWALAMMTMLMSTTMLIMMLMFDDAHHHHHQISLGMTSHERGAPRVCIENPCR